MLNEDKRGDEMYTTRLLNISSKKTYARVPLTKLFLDFHIVLEIPISYFSTTAQEELHII